MRSVGSDSAGAAGSAAGKALDLCQRHGAGVGHALAVNGVAAVNEAGGAGQRAGLAQLGIDARFQGGTAFGGAHIDIAVSDADGDHVIGHSRGGNGKKGGEGKNETHGCAPELREGVGGGDAVDRHSVAVCNSGAVHKSMLQMRIAGNSFQRLQPIRGTFSGTR